MKEKNKIDLPVKFVIRTTRNDKEMKERALLVAIDEKGREYAFTYNDELDEMQDLTVCNL